MKKFFSIVLLLVSVVTLWAQDVPTKKQTTVGLYVTAQQAFGKWQTDQSIVILDVRTPAEYVFVGHAPMALNIPFMTLKDEYNPEKKMLKLVLNEKFVSLVQENIPRDATLFLMCRSGGRSAKAVNLLAKNGYKNLYSIIDGFEGDKLSDPKSYNDGKRILNGWKNSSAPWTYSLKPDQLFY